MSIPNFLFLDIESKKVSDDFGGWGDDILLPGEVAAKTNTLFMEFGVACVYDIQGVQFFDDAYDLFLYLINPSVDAIVTFNGEAFDFPLLLGSLEPPDLDASKTKLVFSKGFNEGYSLLKRKSIDILREIVSVLGHRVSLEQVTCAMGDKNGKLMDGKEWWKFYNSSKLEDKVKATNYLLKDVFDVYKIFAIANELGLLAYRDNLGATKKFSIKLPTLEDLKKR